MKTRKTVIAVLTAALIAALIIGCIAPLDTANSNAGDEDLFVPEGKTLVRLSLGDSNSGERTIKPDPSSAYPAISNIPYFLLTVHNDSTNANVSLTSTPFATYCNYATFSSTNTIPLDSGKNYTFLVLACNNNVGDSTTKYVAWGSAEITGLTGSSVNVPITLKEISGDAKNFDNSAIDSQGTFSWNFGTTLNSYGTATLTLTALAGGTTSITNLDVKTTPTNNTGVALASGFYRMILALGDTGYETGYVREIVHIYSGFTTICDSTALGTLPTLRQNVFTVTYNYGTNDQGVSELRTQSEDLNFGDVILDEITNTNPSYVGSGYHFNGWYKGSVAGGNNVSATERIMKAITLVADWAVNTFTNVDLSLTLSWSEGGNYGNTLTFGSLSQVVYDETDKKITLSLAISGETGTITSKSWFIDNQPVTYDEVITFSSTLSSKDILWQPGNHTVTVEVDGDKGKGSYSSTFTYTPTL